MAVRSLDLANPIIQSANARGREAVAPLEGPEPREDPDPPGSTPSGFELPGARAWREKHAAVASFSSGIYGHPYWKRRTWRRELRDRATLSGDCRRSIPRSRHLTARGKVRSRDPAKHPLLRETYAKLWWMPGNETCPSKEQPGRLHG